MRGKPVYEQGPCKILYDKFIGLANVLDIKDVRVPNNIPLQGKSGCLHREWRREDFFRDPLIDKDHLYQTCKKEESLLQK